MKCNKRRVSWLGVLICIVVMAACSPVVELETPTISIPELLPIQPLTAYPTMTESSSSTATLAPTETSTPIQEHDLHPAFIDSIKPETQIFRGVKVIGDFTTDQSLWPEVKVTAPDATKAEYITRTIFDIWWYKTGHTGIATEEDFNKYLKDWADAQVASSDDPELVNKWAKVQIDNFYAYDQESNVPYATGQKPYSVWPLFYGTAPEGIRKIDKISIALVRGNMVKNITITIADFDEGYSTIFDNDTLLFYVAPSYGSVAAPGTIRNEANVMATLPWYASRNTGHNITISGSRPKDNKINDLLLTSGFKNQ